MAARPECDRHGLAEETWGRDPLTQCFGGRRRRRRTDGEVSDGMALTNLTADCPDTSAHPIPTGSADFGCGLLSPRRRPNSGRRAGGSTTSPSKPTRGHGPQHDPRASAGESFLDSPAPRRARNIRKSRSRTFGYPPPTNLEILV